MRLSLYVDFVNMYFCIQIHLFDSIISSNVDLNKIPMWKSILLVMESLNWKVIAQKLLYYQISFI